MTSALPAGPYWESGRPAVPGAYPSGEVDEVPTMIDLRPQAGRVKKLLDGVSDSRLQDPTPCEDYTVGDLVNHLVGLTAAFRDAAAKNLGPNTDVDPKSAPAPPLPGDWRTRLPRQLDELAAAWRSEAAWTGETRAGGVTLPGEVAGLVAVNELVLHGWDLARATGQLYEADPDALRASVELLSQSLDPAQRGEIFGPVVEVPQDAPLLDRAVGLGGRRPDWAPTE